MKIDEFIIELNKINIFPTKAQLNQLDKYYKLLIEWNEKINLTAITEKKKVYLKHFYDSATLNKIIDLNKSLTLCDIGTGAGFPGVVLKILFPKLKITLVDSLNKRINFLNDVINKLELENIEAIHSRAEDFCLSNREKFDVVVARAVASINVLVEYCVPLIKVNGSFVAMKGSLIDENKLLLDSLPKIKCYEKSRIVFTLPYELSDRTLINISKSVKTNTIFPRKYSEIKKSPL